MKKLISNKGGNEIYGPRWQNIESSSDSESNDGRHSPPSGSTATANQISDIRSAKPQSPTITTGHGDNEDQTQKATGKRVACSKEGELMYRAALQGDWVAAEVLVARDPNLAIDYITEEGDRALHVAASMKNKEFVEKLVDRMSDLTLVDGRGYTACCHAAACGEVEIARLMIDKNPDLVTLRDENNATPLHMAALRGDKEMLSYLLRCTQTKDLPKQEWFDLLLVVIRGRMYDMAIEIIGKDGSITTMFNEEGTALHLLARQDIPNACSPSSVAELVLNIMIEYLDDENEQPEFGELPKKLWAMMQKLIKGSLLEMIRKPHILHDAAKAGNVKLITMIIRTYPQLIWDVTDSNGYTIFHIAVIHRQSDVFNLIHQVEAMVGFRTISQDQQGNNMLHLAAKPTAALNKKKLPPPLQMQSELLWFKAVEKIVPPSCAMMENKQGLKPREVFSKTHKRLLKESEMWMKNTADSCMLIATILLTVVFTAAFTVPGGYGGQTGEPILAKRHWFKVFLVFEVLGFIGSVVSIIMFRTIMASHFTERDFLSKLPTLQMLGFQALALSLVGAFSAFMSSISLFNLSMNGLVWFGFCTLYLFGLLWVIAEFGAVYRDIALKNSIRSRKHTLFNQNPTAGKS